MSLKTIYLHLWGPALSIFLTTVSLAASVSPLSSIPLNIRQSYFLGVAYNGHLQKNDLIAMAAVIQHLAQYPSNKFTEQELAQITEFELAQILTQEFEIEYIEIEASKIPKNIIFEEKINSYTSKEAAFSPLSFMSNGKKYLRLFLHPLRKDRSILKDFTNTPVQKGQFVAQLSESRSVLLFDKKTRLTWSLKLGVPDRIAHFVNKALTSEDAIEHIEISEKLSGLESQELIPQRSYLPEVHGLGFKGPGINEGQNLRLIANAFKDGQYVIPNPATFTKGLAWLFPNLSANEIQSLENEVLVDQLAERAAKIYFHTGLLMNSNHSQNSGIILDKDGHAITALLKDPDFGIDPFHPQYFVWADNPHMTNVKAFQQVHFILHQQLGNQGGFYDRESARKMLTRYREKFITQLAILYGKDPTELLQKSGSTMDMVQIRSLLLGQSREQLQQDFDRREKEYVHKKYPHLEKDLAQAPVETLRNLWNKARFTPALLTGLKRVIKAEPSIYRAWDRFIDSLANQNFEKETFFGMNPADFEISLKAFLEMEAHLFNEHHTSRLERLMDFLARSRRIALASHFFKLLDQSVDDRLAQTDSVNKALVDAQSRVLIAFAKAVKTDQRQEAIEIYPFFDNYFSYIDKLKLSNMNCHKAQIH